MDMSQEEDLKNDLLPLLRCTACGNTELSIEATKTPFGLPMEVSKESLRCKSCEERYPLTNDYIPIMSPVYSPRIKGQSLISENVEANLHIYDSTSGMYYRHIRTKQEIADRIRAAANELLGMSPSSDSSLPKRYHLDFGCGPGQVLEWLSDFRLVQIGLDVSLVNLRNARRRTGAIVVCGDASNMPFVDDAFDLVTESSVLHHIENWKDAINEACRVCSTEGGILLDSEPSQTSMNWSQLACFVYELRFAFYRALSYVKKNKYMFRDTKQARLNQLAEIHHQPGTGFSLTELSRIFSSNGFDTDIIVSPTPELKPRANPNLQSVIINTLSLRNPWNPEYGSFSALAKRKSSRPDTGES